MDKMVAGRPVMSGRKRGENNMVEIDNQKVIRPRGTDNARVVVVIETESLRGAGTEDDQCRKIKQYWDFSGRLLAENDPCIKE